MNKYTTVILICQAWIFVNNSVRSGKPQTLRVFNSNALPTWPHLFDGVLVDEVVVVLVQRTVQRHAVALEQQVLPTWRTLISELADFLLRNLAGIHTLRKYLILSPAYLNLRLKCHIYKAISGVRLLSGSSP